jgi:hypothetical protein
MSGPAADPSPVKRPDLRPLVVAATTLAAFLGTLGSGPAVAAQHASAPASRAVAPTEFTLSSFNVLGSSHTTGARSRYASGVKRIGLAVRLLDRHGVDVVGFQELQMDQFEEFTRLAGDRFGVYPGNVDRRTVQNSIAWSLDSWRLVEGDTIPIPYFNVDYQMPVVLLENVVTGQRAYFSNFHNPAYASNQKRRAEAKARQIAMVNRLSATGLPVFITGDMNEREEYFCTMAAGAPVKAANGGRYRDGVCTPPPNPMPVNWILGVKNRGKFSNYVRDDSRLVNRITNHFVIRADVTINPATVLAR